MCMFNYAIIMIAARALLRLNKKVNSVAWI